MAARIHLVTYATPRFTLRQWLLGASAKANQIVDTVTAWHPRKLVNAGFEVRCQNIGLTERGSGFWAWKPFVIEAKLKEIPDGDLVFYCDVGRDYPFKLLDRSIAPFVNWMAQQGQDIMPGVEIPWEGNVATWTKREALVSLGMDHREVHESAPVQASFSLWRAGQKSRAFAEQWLELCSRRSLVSDDPSAEGLEELPQFRGHRHDQALLTLCCIEGEIAGLNIGSNRPEIDTRHPSQVSELLDAEFSAEESMCGTLLRLAAWPIWQIERQLRQKVKFGEPISE